MMSWLPDAVSGSLIVGFFSFVGLIVSKESKISEFRQEWIKALREDIADGITQTWVLPDAEDPEHIHQSKIMILKASARIKLRINTKEIESLVLDNSISDLGKAMASTSQFDEMTSKRNEVFAASQIVLKKEWSRVKRGERIYRWTLRSVLVLVIALAATSFYKLLR